MKDLKVSRLSKDKESLLNERRRSRGFLKDKASLRRVRGLDRSMRQSLNKSHDQLVDSMRDCCLRLAFSDRLESLFAFRRARLKAVSDIPRKPPSAVFLRELLTKFRRCGRFCLH